MSDTEAPAAPAPVAAAPGSFTVETAVQVKNFIFRIFFKIPQPSFFAKTFLEDQK